jgi:hypothetical protein
MLLQDEHVAYRVHYRLLVIVVTSNCVAISDILDHNEEHVIDVIEQ